MKENAGHKTMWLEAIRGIACLTVLFAHVLSVNSRIRPYMYGVGKIGVWVFLLLSGMLLIRPYLSEKEFKIGNLPEYYLRKILRLLPIYILALLLCYEFEILNKESIVDHLLLKVGWGHFWYMPVIIKFYTVAPIFLLVLSFMKKRWKEKGIYLYGGLISVAMTGFAGAFPYKNFEGNSINIKWYMPVFLMGMLLAIVLWCVKDVKKSYLYDFLVIIPIGVILIATPLFREIIWKIEPSRFLDNKYLYIGACICCIFVCVSRSKWSIGLLEKAKVLQAVGNNSYYIYIFHYVILIKLMSLCGNWRIVFVMTVLATIGITTLCKYVVSLFGVKIRRL